MAANLTSANPSIRVGLVMPFPADEVADYLLRPEALAHWMGSTSQLTASLGSIAWLPHATSSGPPGRGIIYDTPKTGKVVALAWPAGKKHAIAQGIYEIVVTLGHAPGTERVTLRISPRPGGTCRLRIQHSGLADKKQVDASLYVWQAALRRLGFLMVQASHSSRRERQAVILVHGIGEQRPGQLLREFISNVFGSDARERYFVKPDYVSSLFEMRMASVPRYERTRPTTDIYELYWAHLIRDTTLAQVYRWLLRLARSRDDRIPKTLIRLVWVLRGIGLALLAAFAWLMTKDVSGWLKGIGGGALVALPGIASLAFKALRDRFVIDYAGDAARYLEPRADNISRRQEIREAGVQLIDALHDGGRYSRIIVYGHSLGSVIAYDILSHAWGRRSRDRDDIARTSSRALRALEDLLNPRPGKALVPPAGIEQVQAMQHAAWLEYRRNGFKWRVSDFVTAGSPLAHARWLLNADARTAFEDLVRERSMPTCPPQTEELEGPKRRVFTFTHAYKALADPLKSRSVQVPHHGGLFALTRWTNLYFPYKGLIDGDPVAGEVADCFGSWVKDMKLRETEGFAHTRYTNRALEADAVDHLRTALRLAFRRPLVDHVPADLPPTMLD